MRIRAGYEITYDGPAPTPMLLMLNVRPERISDLESPDLIHTAPHAPLRQYRDQFGNLCTRILAPPGRMTLSADFVIRDSGQPDAAFPEAEQWSIEQRPDDVIVYLLGSRYCETQELNDLAWRLFGDVAPGWARAKAIVKYAHERISFGYQHARPTRTAFEAHEERIGVCRDYAHLAITLCRCMNIPARYCTGYLGDIGVPVSPSPMDYSAWMEAYLGGQWRTMDARHDKPRVGRIMMAYGRDATDVAIVTNFGPATLTDFKVITEELRQPLARSA
jgi:transglutaminase-like putative cysteine protease